MGSTLGGDRLLDYCITVLMSLDCSKNCFFAISFFRSEMESCLCSACACALLFQLGVC